MNNQLMKHLLLIGLLFFSGTTVAQYSIKSCIDIFTFGNLASEKKHTFQREQEGEMLNFKIKVDSISQNYFTMKYWGSDSCNVVNVVYINDKQIGYERHGDYGPINRGFGQALPGRFYYCTILLPLHLTKGKESVGITIKSIDKNRKFNRQFYQAYSHTAPYLDFSKEKQGERVLKPILAEDISEREKQALVQLYREKQIEDFNRLSMRLDKSPNEKLSIVKYSDELRYYASSLMEPWCPAKTDDEKRKALKRIFQVIDNYVIDYYHDTRLVVRGGHQGDWGGFLGALGEALYLVEALIADDCVLGITAFERFLNEPLLIDTKEGKYTLSGIDANYLPLSRKQTWERALKANYDFSRARLSYIYNQVYYTYEGTWKAHEGLRIIHSPLYEGKARSHQILREALGISPFLGEEVLVSEEGRELNLYHSLFYHDQQALFTDDFLQIVAKGKAKSKRDAIGTVVRRLPYGRHYTGITPAGLTRENGYVGNYGETPNYLPEWFYKTLNHAGDEEVNNDILKLALLNIHARSYTRYTSLDDKGKRIMRMQQVLDERNMAYPGMLAYATRVSTGKAMHFASLEKQMVEHQERYSSPEWKPYWEYAAEAVGFAQQQLVDHQYLFSANGRKYDYCLPETYEYITSKRAEYDRFKEVKAGKVHPLTDFDYYSEDELKELKVNSADYKQFAWADVDCMMAVVRDNGIVLSGVFNLLNRGFAANGKIHIQYKNYDHIVQVATRAKFQYHDYYLRMNDRDVDFMTDISSMFKATPLALAGEVCPITFQPGIGKIVRENFEVDNPYSAYPDYLETRYGRYLFVFNTTRAQYGNEQLFEVEIPEDYKKSEVLDLVSGNKLSIRKGKVTVRPNTALVLKLEKEIDSHPKPNAVDFVKVLAGNNKAAVSWKLASGGTSYKVKRSFEEDGDYEIIGEGIRDTYFVDEKIKNGMTAYYKVVAVNNNGQSWDSYRGKVKLEVPTLLTGESTIWRDDKIGNMRNGTVAIDKSRIVIRTDDGLGLGQGDDNMIHTRDIEDSFLFVHTFANGNTEISARLLSKKSIMSGLMLRDQLSENTRYVFLGCDLYGNIVFQNRSRDSRREYTNHRVSPFSWPVVSQTIFQYPYLKLSRNAETHMVAGYISKDGQNWEKLGELYTPFPKSLYVGVGAANTTEAVFEETKFTVH